MAAKSTKSAKSSKTAKSAKKRRAKKVEAKVRRVNNVDKMWFENQLDKVGLSQRQFAMRLSDNLGYAFYPSSLYKALTGTRKFTIQELNEMSRMLAIPLEKIAEKAGIKVHDLPSPSALKIRGWLDQNHQLHTLPTNQISTIRKPIISATQDVIVVRYKTLGTDQELLNGLLIYYNKANSITLDAVGKLCIIETTDLDNNSQGTYFGALKPGFEPGRYNIVSLSGKLVKEDAIVRSASLVIALTQ